MVGEVTKNLMVTLTELRSSSVEMGEPSKRTMVVAASCCCNVFSGAGTGRPVRIERKINGAKYREILEENLLQSAQDLRLGVRVHIPTGQRP